MAKQQIQMTSRFARILFLTLMFLAPRTMDEMPSIAGQGRDREDLSVHNNRWEAVFFREINERSKLARLENLRTVVLQNGDLELRVWIGFGPVSLKGFVINKRGSAWSATYLRSINPSVSSDDYQKILAAPKSGWEGLWKRLSDDGVLTLPGSSESGWLDGESFVVEIKTGRTYRTYMYNNPEFKKSPEGRKIIEIVQTIRDEFDVPR